MQIKLFSFDYKWLILQLYEVLKILRKMIKQGSSFILFRVFLRLWKNPRKI